MLDGILAQAAIFDGEAEHGGELGVDHVQVGGGQGIFAVGELFLPAADVVRLDLIEFHIAKVGQKEAADYTFLGGIGGDFVAGAAVIEVELGEVGKCHIALFGGDG